MATGGEPTRMHKEPRMANPANSKETAGSSTTNDETCFKFVRYSFVKTDVYI